MLLRLEGFEVQVNGKTLPVSVAAGWKAYEPGDRVEELNEAADRRLYYPNLTSCMRFFAFLR